MQPKGYWPHRGQCSVDLGNMLPSLPGPILMVWACNPPCWLMRLIENAGDGESARREVAGVKEYSLWQKPEPTTRSLTKRW